MNKVVFIYQYNKLNNGHSILDKRLCEALQRVYNGKLIALQYDLEKKKIVEDVSIRAINSSESIIILSHFNIFSIARNLRKSRIIFINHDLPYYAYFASGNPLYFAKGLYSWLYIHRCWKFADFIFFISKVELYKSRMSLKDAAHLKVGCKPGQRIQTFDTILKEAVFTGNYKWSLKKKSLLNAFKTKYSGSIKLIAVNADEIFSRMAEDAGLSIQYTSSINDTQHIRIGVITDDFRSGFKLKALELISMGCCIASFSDIQMEFDDVAFHKLFINTIKDLNELDTVYEKLLTEPDVINKFRIFYNDVYENFNWDKSALRIKNKLESIIN